MFILLDEHYESLKRAITRKPMCLAMSKMSIAKLMCLTFMIDRNLVTFLGVGCIEVIKIHSYKISKPTFTIATEQVHSGLLVEKVLLVIQSATKHAEMPNSIYILGANISVKR